MPMDIDTRRALLDSVATLQQAAAKLPDEALKNKVDRLSEAAQDGLLTIAIVGEFGNGKSTLANSLLGASLAPMGMAPATRAACKFIEGPEQRAWLCFTDGVRLPLTLEEIGALRAESIDRASEILIEDSRSLLHGASLLDTPGLGDPHAAPVEVIEQFLDSADCVLFVLNADRLLSMTEISFIEERLRNKGVDQTAFIINRCDGKSDADIAALLDRARHMLQPLVPADTSIIPYSALRALKSKLGNGESASCEDPVAHLVHRWLTDHQRISAASALAKARLIAESLSARQDALREIASHQELAASRSLETLERELESLNLTIEDTCRRAVSGLDRVREQFSVGLKDFALNLRESVPGQVLDVPVDEARRFLPFYIQDSLRRMVEENHDTLRSAVQEVVDGLSSEVGAATTSVLDRFRIDVEPPAIPLYVPREKAPLSQGATFVMGAALAVIFSEVYVGSVILLGGILSREVGRQLESADRRASLANSAQSLVHGSIESMEQSLAEQFHQLEESVVGVIRLAFAPQLGDLEAKLATQRTETASSIAAAQESLALAAEIQQSVSAVRASLAAIPSPGSLPPETPPDSDPNAAKTPDSARDAPAESAPAAAPAPRSRRRKES